jgi:hypothetical protein
MADKDKIWWPGSLTHAEGMYWCSIESLANLAGEAGPLLSASKATGIPAEIVAIARGLRGDAAARKRLHEILADARADMRRAWAARALGSAGTADDLPALKGYAESDPFERERGGCAVIPGQTKFFPVREAAIEAIEAIEKRLRKER